MRSIHNGNKGMTLIELLVAMAIAGIVTAGVYSAYVTQAKSYNTQQLTVDMQENLRIALELLQTDLRLAGSDPTGEADAGFTSAGPSSVSFTMDITGGEDDKLDNNKNYLVDEGSNKKDDDGDGFKDEFDEGEWYDGDTLDEGENITWALNGTTLTRTTTRFDENGNPIVNPDNIALNVEQFNLVYLDSAGKVLNDDGAGNVTSNLNLIRTVQITLIARISEDEAPMTVVHKDTNVYTNQQGDVILDMSAASANMQSIRRRIVSAEVNCRNMF